MFVRFVLLRLHPDTGVKDGVFDTAYELCDGGTLPAHAERELRELLHWFDDNLDQPMRFNRTTSKGYYHRATRGISWFKPTASEQIKGMHRLVAILEEYGHHVTMIKVRNPGYIVYEDDYQVVAEPFSETQA